MAGLGSIRRRSRLAPYLMIAPALAYLTIFFVVPFWSLPRMSPSLDDFIVTFFVSGSTVTYPLFVNAAFKVAVPPQIDVFATAIPVISLVLLALGTLYPRRRVTE